MDKEQKKKSPITFRLSDDEAYLQDYLENRERFRSVSEGVVKSITLCSELLGYNTMEGSQIKELLDYLEYSRVLSLKEIADNFTVAEWNTLADALSETFVRGKWRFNLPKLVFHCEEGIEMQGLISKWKVNQEELVAKIKTLTAAQVDALYSHIEEYGEMKDRENAKPTESDLRIVVG